MNAVLPGALSRLSTADDYVRHIESLHSRGILDDGLRAAALDPAPPEYVAPLYVFLAGPRAGELTGQIYSAAGGFVGRYDEVQPTFIAYRDHKDAAPYSVEELAQLLT